jgi:hypothetical protein
VWGEEQGYYEPRDTQEGALCGMVVAYTSGEISVGIRKLGEAIKIP